MKASQVDCTVCCFQYRYWTHWSLDPLDPELADPIPHLICWCCLGNSATLYLGKEKEKAVREEEGGGGTGVGAERGKGGVQLWRLHDPVLSDSF
jgi:hypothetical protein